MIKRWLAYLAVAFVAACGGGGGDAGRSVFGGDSSTPTTPQAADMSLVLSAASLPNNGTDKIKVSVTAVDANRNALAGIPITLSVDSDAVIASNDTKTDAAGVVTADVSIGQNQANRTVTVTARSGNLVRTASFQVTGAALTATAVPKVTAPGSENNQIQYRLVNAAGNPMANQSLTVSGSGIASTTATTGANGEYTFTYTAPSTTGTLTVSASAAGVTLATDVLVQASSTSVPPAAQSPQSTSIHSDKNVVTTGGRAEVRVLFLGSNNAPIPNMRVRFDLDGDPNSIGGSLTSGSNIVYSDAKGEAVTAYVAGTRSSPTDGVVIRACFSTHDFADHDPASASVECSPALSAVRTRLTVSGDPLSVSIGTDNLVVKDNERKTYLKDYVVMVVDAAGNAKADVLVTPSIDLPRYYKGHYVWNGGAKAWTQVMTLGATESFAWNATVRAWQRVGTGSPSCPQEDVNRNGSREALPWSIGDTQDEAARPLSQREEDLNWSGSLEARKADVAIRVIGSNKTDERGTVLLRIEYPQNVATWVDFAITVAAAGVAGSEGRAQFLGTLVPLASDMTQEQVSPPFVTSPYGTGSLCTNTN